MMLDEKTKVFLLLDEAEKRQKTAEQQQAALKDLLQASKTAGSTLDKAIAALPSTVQRAVDQAVPNAVATAMNRAAQTAAQALEKATAGPVERLKQAVTCAEQAITNIEQASRQVNWQWVLLILLAGFLLGTLANYLLFANFIRHDLVELRQRYKRCNRQRRRQCYCQRHPGSRSANSSYLVYSGLSAATLDRKELSVQCRHPIQTKKSGFPPRFFDKLMEVFFLRYQTLLYLVK